MRPWLLPLVGIGLALTGCQTIPETLPQAEPSPAAECRWPAGPGDSLARVVTALEHEGFLVRHTDVSLGLVGAERARNTVYHDHGVDRLPRFGGFVLGGSGGHMASGVMIGIGGGIGPATHEATRIERLSVVVGAQQVQVSRDIRIFDWRGELRESRSASDAAFCRDLRDAIEAVTLQEAP